MRRIRISSSSKSGSQTFLYLTTRGRRSGLLREIEIWFTEHAGRYYLIAEYPTANWVQNIRAHHDVRVRIGDEEFAGHARVVAPDTEPELDTQVQKLSREKYGWGDGLVVEIIPARKT